MQIFFTESFHKKLLKDVKYLRSSRDPESYWCGHQQLVFADFWTVPDNSGEPKSIDSKQKKKKITVTGEIFSLPFISK